MGLCVSTVVAADNAGQRVPLNNPEVKAAGMEPRSVQEIVQEQPKRTKNFGADDNPLPAAGCCLCCIDPTCCGCCDCCCDCSDCLVCSWCLNCDCCGDCCDECCTQCI